MWVIIAEMGGWKLSDEEISDDFVSIHTHHVIASAIIVLLKMYTGDT